MGRIIAVDELVVTVAVKPPVEDFQTSECLTVVVDVRQLLPATVVVVPEGGVCDPFGWNGYASHVPIAGQEGGVDSHQFHLRHRRAERPSREAHDALRCERVA